MVEQLSLADHDVAFIADFIDYLIMRILPGWIPSADEYSSGGRSLYESTPAGGLDLTMHPRITTLSGSHAKSVKQDTSSEVNADPPIDITADRDNLRPNSNHIFSHATLHFVQPSASSEDKESQGSITSEVMGADAAITNENISACVDYGIDGASKGSSGQASEMEFRDSYYDEFKMQENYGGGIEYVPWNECANSGMTFAVLSRAFREHKVSPSSLSFLQKDQDAELKMELDAIEMQYQHWLKELTRMGEEAIEATKKRWIDKKETSSSLNRSN